MFPFYHFDMSVSSYKNTRQVMAIAVSSVFYHGIIFIWQRLEILHITVIYTCSLVWRKT